MITPHTAPQLNITPTEYPLFEPLDLQNFLLEPRERQDVVEIFNPDGSKYLVANRPFKAGQIIATLPSYSQHSEPTRYTVQTGSHQHTNIGFPWASANHSCAPNLIFDTARMLITATRDIKTGEEITFFYPSTEWDMAEPFLCHCRSTCCLEHIAGASHIPMHTLSRYFMNAHILAMLQQR